MKTKVEKKDVTKGGKKQLRIERQCICWFSGMRENKPIKNLKKWELCNETRLGVLKYIQDITDIKPEERTVRETKILEDCMKMIGDIELPKENKSINGICLRKRYMAHLKLTNSLLSENVNKRIRIAKVHFKTSHFELSNGRCKLKKLVKIDETTDKSDICAIDNATRMAIPAPDVLLNKTIFYKKYHNAKDKKRKRAHIDNRHDEGLKQVAHKLLKLDTPEKKANIVSMKKDIQKMQEDNVKIKTDNVRLRKKLLELPRQDPAKTQEIVKLKEETKYLRQMITDLKGEIKCLKIGFKQKEENMKAMFTIVNESNCKKIKRFKNKNLRMKEKLR